MKKIERSSQQIAGWLVAALGAVVACRWIFQIEVIASLIPGSAKMGIVAPALFICAGICLVGLPVGERPGAWHAGLVKLAGGLLVALPALVLVEHVFSVRLGIDFVRNGTLPTPEAPFPGRVSPNACIGFLLAGAAFLLAGSKAGRLRDRALTAATWGVTVVGFGGAAGYLLGLESLYRLASFNGMLLPTAIGLSTVAVGLWLLREQVAGRSDATFESHQRGIIGRSAAVLTVVALAAGIAGYSVLRETFEANVADSLALVARTNASSFASSIEGATGFPRTIASRPALHEALLKLQARPGDAEARAFLQKVADSVLAGGMGGVRLFTTEGEAVASAGAFVRDQALVRNRVLNAGQPATLVWRDGYLLYTETEVTDGARSIGTVVTEQRLPLLDRLLADIRAINGSADALVCGQEGDHAVCAPTRLYARPVEIPMFDANGRLNLPINHALAGESGVATVKDLRGVKVMAAYVPLAHLGLGLVVKTDVESLYAPLRPRLNLLAALLLGLVGAGTVALRRHVRPLLATRKDLEDELHAATAGLRTVLDELPAIVSHWNTDGTNRFANRACLERFGYSADEMRGRHVKDVLGPQLHAACRPFIDAALEGRQESFEPQYRAPDGTVWHNHTVFVPEKQGGVVTGLIVLVTDITRRKRAEESLAESERRYRSLYGETPAMMHSVDAEGRIVTVSRRWLARMGYEEHEVVGRLAADFFTAAARDRQRQVLGPEFLRTGVLRDAPSQLFTQRGEVIDTLVSMVARRDESGAVIGALAVFEDVTSRLRTEQRLRSSEEFLHTCGRIAGMGGWQVDIRTGTLAWSAETRRIHEVDDDYQPVVAKAIEFYAPESRPLIADAVQRGMAHGTPWDLELRLFTAKGREIWVRAAGEVQFEGDRPVRLFGAFQDITARKRMERELVEKHELLRVTLKCIGDAVITTDARGRVEWLNPVAERMTGWLVDEAAGKPLPMVFHVVDEDTRLPAEDPVALCIESRSPASLDVRTVLVARDGTEYGIEDSVAPIRDDEDRLLGAVLVFHDVSEQRRLTREMSFRATHDELTGLVNRTEFEARLARVVFRPGEERAPNAMLLIDLDQFKLVNDACGHAMGDQLLCQFSRLLEGCVRGRDTIGRLGGDEFGVILEHCSVDQALRVAQQICDQMEEFRFVHDGRRFRIGASIGLVPVDSRWSHIDAALQAADTSCGAAKEAGRNRVHMWFDTDAAMRQREGETEWASRLEQALDDDLFELYGQRIVPIAAGVPAVSAAPADAGLHVEVLLRLRQPDGSVIAPGAFLPAAERFHMASRIDRWVVREVFGWLHREAHALGHLGMVSVNLSGQSIGDRAFHRFVSELIATMPFDAAKLCFEVTETAAITHMADATAFIRDMRRQGIRIALDDFGAGASSFAYLRALPVDFLKIDGQFVRDLIDDPLDQAAVRCFQDVARVVGVKTVAEYVESEPVLALLREIGVDCAQGYLLHRPEPLADVVAAWGPAARVTGGS